MQGNKSNWYWGIYGLLILNYYYYYYYYDDDDDYYYFHCYPSVCSLILIFSCIRSFLHPLFYSYYINSWFVCLINNYFVQAQSRLLSRQAL